MKAGLRFLVLLGLVAGCSEGTSPTAPEPGTLAISPAAEAGEWQRGLAGTELANPLQVVVTRGGQPVAGVAVSWATQDGVITGSGVTDRAGLATARWLLPRRAFYGLVAQAKLANDDTGVTFHAAAEYPELEVVDGDRQEGTAGDLLPAPLRVRATWKGAPVAGQPITWSENVTPLVDRTTADGIAAANWRLDAVAGSRQAWARVETDGPLASFRVTARCRPGDSCGTARPPLAFVGPGGVYVGELGGIEATLVVPGGTAPSWSPSGDQIAFARTGWRWQLCIGQPDGSQERCFVGGGGPALVGGPFWSPDGRKIVAGVNGGYIGPALQVLDVASFRVDTVNLSTIWSVRAPTSWSISWSPDGRRIAFAGEGGLGVVNPDGSGLRLLKLSENWDVAWSPDGQRIAFAGAGGLGVVNPDGSGLRYLTPQWGAFLPAAVAWSPDGSQLAVGVWDPRCPSGCETAIGRMAADGTQFEMLVRGAADGEHVYSPVWSPDGTRLAYTSEFEWGPTSVYALPIAGGPREIVAFGSGVSWRRAVVPPAGRSPAWPPTSRP